jgi:TolB-like protein
MKDILLSVFTATLVLLSLAGCGSGKLAEPFAGQGLKGGEGVRAAILPFDNLSDDQGAGKTMENLILVEFLKNTTAHVIDPGEVMAALLEERIRLATSIPRATVLSLGQRLEVDYFVLGIVHEYRMMRMSGAGGSGEVPVVSITLRILDARTGDIVWATSAARRGNDREKVFGIGRIDSIEQLAQITAGDIARNFAESRQRVR